MEPEYKIRQIIPAQPGTTEWVALPDHMYDEATHVFADADTVTWYAARPVVAWALAAIDGDSWQVLPVSAAPCNTTYIGEGDRLDMPGQLPTLSDVNSPGREPVAITTLTPERIRELRAYTEAQDAGHSG